MNRSMVLNEQLGLRGELHAGNGGHGRAAVTRQPWRGGGSKTKVIVYTKIWKESHRNSKAPRIMSSRNQLHADRNQLIQMQKLESAFF